MIEDSIISVWQRTTNTHTLNTTAPRSLALQMSTMTTREPPVKRDKEEGWNEGRLG